LDFQNCAINDLKGEIKMNEEKTCFVIAPIGKPDSETRKRSDKVFKYIIEDVVSQKGYKPLRADQISEPGIITSQVIQYVVDSPLVVADLSEHNPNVFYELAIRHIIKKPIIQLIKEEDRIPFDVAPSRMIIFNITDLDSVDNAKTELTKQIDLIEKGEAKIDNPISIAFDLKSLKQSENISERMLGDILQGISDLKSELNSIKRKDNALKWEAMLERKGFLNALENAFWQESKEVHSSRNYLMDLIKTEKNTDDDEAREK
jgi:hypothetical protein